MSFLTDKNSFEDRLEQIQKALEANDLPAALVVAISILTIILWANNLGALLPLAAAVKLDPTVVSGPAMSTLVDATGLFIYFTVARIVLGL